jgi:hypothetical protein|tara:strand:- start:150 stop:437 length:288 start_codon:yes stop_codon:yes gene_type:complete
MDNRYFDYGCPPLMSDGRFLTSYIDSDILNQYIRNVNKLESSNDFRVFLQKNGQVIINRERAYLLKNNSCNVNGRCMKENIVDPNCRGCCPCEER